MGEFVDIGPMVDFMKRLDIDLFPHINNEWASGNGPRDPLTIETLKFWLEDREGFLAEVFNKPRAFVRWWMNWRADGYLCQATTKKGLPCKAHCWYGDTSLENFFPGLTEFCDVHKDPDASSGSVTYESQITWIDGEAHFTGPKMVPPVPPAK